MIVINPRILLASAVSLLVLGACNSDQQAKSAAPAVKATVEATVNGIAISKSRVDLIANQNAGAGQPDSPDMRKGIVDQLIMQTLVTEEAVKKGLDKSAEVTEQVELGRQSILSDAYVQDFIKNNPVSDDTLKTEYERFKGNLGNEYKARHILVEKEAEAKDIIDQWRAVSDEICRREGLSVVFNPVVEEQTRKMRGGTTAAGDAETPPARDPERVDEAPMRSANEPEATSRKASGGEPLERRYGMSMEEICLSSNKSACRHQLI